MLTLVCFGAVVVLAVLAVTRHRVIVIGGFYSFFVLLTVLGEFFVPHLGPLSVYRALYAVLAISILFRWMQDRTFAAQIWRWPLLPYVFLMALVFASALYSISGTAISWESDWNLWNHAVVMLMFVVAACHVKRPRDLNIFAAVTAIASIVLSLYVIKSAAQLDFEAYRGGDLVDQNYISAFLFMGMLPLVNALLTWRSLWRFLWIPVLVVEVSACLILASRGMFVAFAGAALWMLMSSLRGRRRWAVVGILTLLLLVVGLAFLLPGSQALLNRFQESDIGTLDNRMTIWKASWTYFANSGVLRMVFGQGADSAPVVLGPVIDLLNYHNEYVRWLMDQGVLGLGAMLFFFYAVGRRALAANHPLKHLMMGWIIFFVINGLTETLCDAPLFWLVMGVIAGAGSVMSAPDRAGQVADERPAPVRPGAFFAPQSAKGT